MYEPFKDGLRSGPADEQSLEAARHALSGLRIGVVYGPASEEDAVYIRDCPPGDWSLTSIMAVLQRWDLSARHLDPTGEDFPSQVREVDVVLINIHGPYGEDGRLQGFLDYLGVPYTGSGVLASSVGMDKLVAKAVMRDLGVPVLPDSGLLIRPKAVGFEFPAMLKAVDGGSSVGIELVRRHVDLPAACALLERRGFDRYFLEQYQPGRSVTVSLFASASGPLTLPILETVSESEFYDEQSKLGGVEVPSVDYRFPHDLSPDTQAAIVASAHRIFEFLGCCGAARVDFIVTPDGSPFCLEVNTIPGLQRHSNLPLACRQSGISYDALILYLLADAVSRRRPVPWTVRDGLAPST